jgi:hypothetical protein
MSQRMCRSAGRRLDLQQQQSNEEKAAFVTNLQKTNLEREKAHLKPLDWCSEAYKFDKGWATENTECGQRVAAYEAGDKTALAQ